MNTNLHLPATSEISLVPATHIVLATTPLPAPRAGSRWDLRALGAPAASIRELQTSDAASLCSLLSDEPVARFIYPPPTHHAGFVRFIEWTRQEQEAGRQIAFAMVPPGREHAAGIIQVRQCESDFSRAEWGFVLGQQYWGTGLFMASAEIVLRFLFECVGVRRLEARSVALNGRGNAVLAKLGALQEGRLRRAFCKDGQYFDEVLWTILASDWRQGRLAAVLRPH